MKEKICFAIQQQLRQYTLPECHLVNFHGIYVCQSQPAAEFSAFPCCCVAGTLVEISRTSKRKLNDLQGPDPFSRTFQACKMKRK